MEARRVLEAAAARFGAPWLRPDNGRAYPPEPMAKLCQVAPLPADFLDPAAPPSPFERLRLIAGASAEPPQHALLGTRCKNGEPVGLNLNECFATGFFGVPNFGKSYGLGVVVEGAVQAHENINRLQRPWCVLALHYHPGASYPPELLTSLFPNLHEGEVERLQRQFRTLNQGLDDVVLLTLPERVAALRRRYPYCQVHGIRFALAELGVDGVGILLGFPGQSPLYGRQLQALLRELRRRVKAGERLTLRLLCAAIERFPFHGGVKELIAARLELLRGWVDDGRSLRALLQPGRLVIVDIRDEWLEHELAMTLFGLVNAALVLSSDRRRGEGGHVMVVIDEAHKFSGSKLVRGQLETMVRERRHLRLSVLLSSQDPLSVPEEVLTLLDCVGVFRHESPKWARYLAAHNAALAGISVAMTRELLPGQMYFWAREWCHRVSDLERTDVEGWMGLPGLPVGPVRVELRPRISHHGGATLTAVPG